MYFPKNKINKILHCFGVGQIEKVTIWVFSCGWLLEFYILEFLKLNSLLYVDNRFKYVKSENQDIDNNEKNKIYIYICQSENELKQKCYLNGKIVNKKKE